MDYLCISIDIFYLRSETRGSYYGPWIKGYKDSSCYTVAWGFQRCWVSLLWHVCCAKVSPPTASKLPTMLSEFHIAHDIKMLRSRVGNDPAVFQRLPLNIKEFLCCQLRRGPYGQLPTLLSVLIETGRTGHWCRQKWSRAKLSVRSVRNFTFLRAWWVEDLRNDLLHERGVVEIGEAPEIFHGLDFRGAFS
jgi:hypothetical protein